MTFKEFSWERYQAGEEVQYRDGGKPDEILKFNHEDCDFPVVTKCKGDTYGHTIKGLFYTGDTLSKFDLVMKPKKKTVWVNLYKKLSGEVVTYSQRASEIEPSAIVIEPLDTCVGTFPIEIEE